MCAICSVHQPAVDWALPFVVTVVLLSAVCSLLASPVLLVWFAPWFGNRGAARILGDAKRRQYERDRIPHFVVGIHLEPPFGWEGERGVLTIQNDALVYEGRRVNIRIRRDNIIQAMAGHSFARGTWIYGKEACLQLREPVNGHFRVHIQSREYSSLVRAHCAGWELEKALDLFVNGVRGMPAAPTPAGSVIEARTPSAFGQPAAIPSIGGLGCLWLAAVVGVTGAFILAGPLPVAALSAMAGLYALFVYMPWLAGCASVERWCRREGPAVGLPVDRSFVVSLTFAPRAPIHSEAIRSFASFPDDIGTLTFDDNLLRYAGDAVDFALARTDVAKASFCRAQNWDSSEGIVVPLREPITGFTRITIRVNEGYTVFHKWRRGDQLLGRMRKWVEGGRATAGETGTRGEQPPAV